MDNHTIKMADHKLYSTNSRMLAVSKMAWQDSLEGFGH